MYLLLWSSSKFLGAVFYMTGTESGVNLPELTSNKKHMSV